MLRPLVLVLLVALFSSVLLVQVSGTTRRDMLTKILRSDLANDKVRASDVNSKFKMVENKDILISAVLFFGFFCCCLLGSHSLAPAQAFL